MNGGTCPLLNCVHIRTDTTHTHQTDTFEEESFFKDFVPVLISCCLFMFGYNTYSIYAVLYNCLILCWLRPSIWQTRDSHEVGVDGLINARLAKGLDELIKWNDRLVIRARLVGSLRALSCWSGTDGQKDRDERERDSSGLDRDWDSTLMLTAQRVRSEQRATHQNGEILFHSIEEGRERERENETLKREHLFARWVVKTRPGQCFAFWT